MLFQEICKEWEKKPEGEKQFEPFYRAVSAVAHSTGTRLKTRVHLLNQVRSFCPLVYITVTCDMYLKLNNEFAVSVILWKMNSYFIHLFYNGSKNGEYMERN